MKKIGIITFHNAHNHGAMLQAYALQKTLSAEHNVEIINFLNPLIEKSYKTIQISHNSILSCIKSLTSSIVYLPETLKRRRNFIKFSKKYLKLGQEYNSESELKNNPPKKDIYITGSDQVWNYTLTNGLSDIYTLNFGDKKITRISYAASIGVSKLSEELKETYKKKLSILDHISVRELQARKVLSEFIEKDLSVVLDPTLLLTKNEWDQLIIDIPPKKEKYIFVYGIGKQKKLYNLVNYLSTTTGIKIVPFNKTNGKYKNIYKKAYSYGPIEFLSMIKNAEYTVVRSFHGMIFSIIFHKKFFVVPDENTNSRMYDLLKKLDLSDRIVNDITELKDINREIDYDLVDKIIEKERKKSINYLKEAINNQNNKS